MTRYDKPRGDTRRHVVVDTFGTPIYDGEPDLLEEYCERALDYYYSKTGKASEQGASAITLRTCLTGAAYKATKGLDHEMLLTSAPVDEDGKVTGPAPRGAVDTLIQALREAIADEKPIRATELFDKVLYSQSVWRGTGETMSAYTTRRQQDFKELANVSSSTSVSDDIKAYLLLKFANVPPQQHPSVVSSAGNAYDSEKFIKALRMQFPNINEKEHRGQPPGRTEPHWSRRPAKAYFADPEHRRTTRTASRTTTTTPTATRTASWRMTRAQTTLCWTP